jgi:hypothetical protein
MTFNSDQIIQEVHKEFEQMLDFVTNEAAYTATADQIERGLFKRLLQMGYQLLCLFFEMRSQASSRDTYQTAEGQTLPYHRDSQRTYLSLFGKLSIARPYFYLQDVGSACPLDAELSLGEDRYSNMVCELTEYLGVYGAYHKAVEMMERMFDVRLSTRALQEQILQDAADVTAYYEQQEPPLVTTEAEVLVIQADGKGVPIIKDTTAESPVRLSKGQKRGQKKEAIVTTAYTLATAPRTADAVLNTYYKLADAPECDPVTRSGPQNKRIWATLEGKDTALDRLVQQVTARTGEHIQHRVALCDGCAALQTRIAHYFPDFTLILDFIHANEYLWDVANALLGESSAERLPWMVTHTRQLLTGQAQAVIDEFRLLSRASSTTVAQQEQLNKTANYFERNLPYMDYAAYLAQGWPIASGVIEGACRHFVKDRCELSGMRWSQLGAEQLLHLRAVAENDDWDAYHDFRRRARHQRLYDQPYPEYGALESWALAA